MIINYILEKLAQNIKCSLHVFEKSGTIRLCYCYEQISMDPFETDSNLYAWLCKELSTKSDIAVITEDKTIIYGVFKDIDECLYVFGPMAIEELNRSRVYDYRKKHNIPDGKYQFPVNSAIAMANILAIAVGVVVGKESSEDQILGLTPEVESGKPVIKDWDIEKYSMFLEENGEKRINYQEEQVFYDYIRNGIVDKFNRSTGKNLEYPKYIGKMANSTQKKWEYMAVVSIALSSRAAIEGGLRPYIAYNISDLYLQQLEKCNGVIEMMQMIPMMQRDFAQRVKNTREHKKSIYYIEQCKDIIAQNIHQPITVEDIALKIGINRTYLSRKFAEQEGISISNYIVNIRLNAAVNMLKYSDVSIHMISDYFCFSSQSYFAGLFKKKYGVTPLVYRQNNCVIDFLK